MSDIFFRPNKPMPSNVRNYIKRAGYVRGYFPELLDYMGSWTPGSAKATGKFMWNNMGRLATLAALAAGGYYAYNKWRKGKEKKKTEDDKYYSNVPKGVRSDSKSDKKWDNYEWDDDEDSDSSSEDIIDEDVPLSVLADAYGYKRTGRAAAPQTVSKTIDLANQAPGTQIVVKTSQYILDKSNKRVNVIKNWLNK